MFYVYVDWTTEDVPRPFYVGKGNLGRVKALTRNKHHTNVTKTYGLNRKIMFETDDENRALNEERKLITELKTYVYASDYVFGCNYTTGGEGASGAHHVWSHERREGASRAQKKSFENVERIKKHVEATKKQWNNNLRRTQQSERMKRQNPSQKGFDSEITRQRKSNSQKIRYKNPEERKKMSILTTLSCQNVETRTRRSQAQKQRRARERLEKEKETSC